MSTPERPPRRGAGQRAGLSRETVLTAARRIADDEGVDRLTMRRLAGELGVMPNALYTYIPDKEALLDALLDDLLAGIDAGDPAELLRRGGLEGERAVEAFRILLIYSLGFAAFQAPRLQSDSVERTRQVEATFAGLPEDRFPEMRRHAAPLADPTTDRHFHTGLRWLLDGLSAQSRDG